MSMLSTVEIKEKITKINFRRTVLNIIFWVIVPMAVTYYSIEHIKTSKIKYVQEQQTTCPSLLSIARSARDTLIVMRDKSMCTEYMLENLK